MIDRVLEHLAALVAFDTRNPPRAIGTGGIFDYIRAQLPDDRMRARDKIRRRSAPVHFNAFAL